VNAYRKKSIPPPHDVSETQAFERVLVMEGGQLIEDGSPATLAQQQDSRYRAMLETEAQVQAELWGSRTWRKLWMEKGRLSENPRPEQEACVQR